VPGSGSPLPAPAGRPASEGVASDGGEPRLAASASLELGDPGPTPAAALPEIAAVAEDPADGIAGGEVVTPALATDADVPPPTPHGVVPSRELHADVAATSDEPLEPETEQPGLRGDRSQTHVFRRPSPESARAILRMLGSDGRERSVEVDGRPLTVGRARDNGLVIDDARVSRHHGRLLARHGALVYADLDSTNGSRVNGVRVDEIALGVGDRILVGDTVLVVESLPG
jgi:hypothetical protein